ncbi:MAG TPA: branched-chain amino acid ABC transporter permease [Chloroflexia bacterium]|nr:branched-chain amino acid ABC transporter permease [Chloroflexia bacterium]
MNLSTLPQQLLNGVFSGSIYALFALGYTLVFGVLDILNLAHAAIFMMAAVVSWWLVADQGWSLFAAFPAGVLLAGALGILLDRVAFLRLRRRGAGHLSPMISSIGMALIFVGLAGLLFKPDRKQFPMTAFPQVYFDIGTMRVRLLDVIILAVSLALMALLTWLVQATPLGKAMRAVAENPRAAALLGVNIEMVIMQTFFIASALGGAAGILYGMSLNSIEPTMGNQVELKGLSIIILGGMGSIPGAVVAGFLIGLIEVLSVVFGRSDLKDAFVFIALFLVLLLRPQGIFGRKLGRTG